jgi:hypothetical protein
VSNTISAVDRLLRWQTLLAIFVADDVLYVLAGATAKKGRHPGILSDVLGAVWACIAVVLIVLVIVAVLRSSRAKRVEG